MWSRRQWLSATGIGLAVVSLRPGRARADDWEAREVDKQLRTLLKDPYSGEPALSALCASWLTPVKHFYVLNHGDVPELDAGDYELVVDGDVRRPLRLSLRELRDQFPSVDVLATLMCAGNRRDEFTEMRDEDFVLPWGPGAIGTARWTGVPLRAVLQKAGAKPAAKHVHLDGRDRVERSDGEITHFAGSIPLDRAMQRGEGPVLLAYAMNGKPLARLHGFPLRAVVPGFIGARSVKWLGRVRVSARPSANAHFVESHRIIRSDQQEISEAAPIYEYPVNAAVCLPEGAALPEGEVEVAGYALAPPGDRIARVQVSVDGGKRWRGARLVGRQQPYCWRLWRARIRIGPETERVIARAVTAVGARMPRSMTWNEGGYLYNAWASVPVRPR